MSMREFTRTFLRASGSALYLMCVGACAAAEQCVMRAAFMQLLKVLFDEAMLARAGVHAFTSPLKRRHGGGGGGGGGGALSSESKA